jgi:parvulin-like peptidyl-prolyl isomerase
MAPCESVLHGGGICRYHPDPLEIFSRRFFRIKLFLFIKRRLCVARTLHKIQLCAIVALLSALCLAHSVQAQSPGVAAAAPQSGESNIPPAWNGQPGNVPYSNLPGAPVQPISPTRPASWPGAPLEYANPSATANPAAPVNSPASAAPAAQTLSPGVAPGSPLQMLPPVTSDASSAGTAAGGMLNPNAAAAASSMAMIPPSGDQMKSPQVLPGPREEYEDGRIVATVGTIPILAGDVRAMINQRILEKIATAPSPQEMPPPEEMKEFYAMYMRPMLKSMVESKMIVNDAKQTIPATAFPKIEGEMNQVFDKEQVPKLMKAYKAANQHELDEKLRTGGSSLDWERRSFMEMMIGSEWLKQQVKEKNPPPADVIGYYEQHLQDYSFPAQVRWEELMVSFDKVPDKAAAHAQIAQMGNQVMQGAPFADVAKQSSQGPTAYKGGDYDWTTQGSLAAKVLDENLFKLPVGSLSPILESDRGFHIIRVVERKNAGKKSFEDTQGDIKKQLKEEDRVKQLKKYLADLHDKTPIHTVYDDQPGGLDGPPKQEEHHF